MAKFLRIRLRGALGSVVGGPNGLVVVVNGFWFACWKGRPNSYEFGYRCGESLTNSVTEFGLERGWAMGLHRNLPRLAKDRYLGFATVHWVFTTKCRSSGWLDSSFHATFREAMLHAAARFSFVCPVYCLMPDHAHLILTGWHKDSDLKNSVRFLRKVTSGALRLRGLQWQRQPYDHVLSDEECEAEAFRSTVEYVARNPERKGLVNPGRFADYQYLGSLVLGFPDLRIGDERFWQRYFQAVTWLKTRYASSVDGV